MRITLSFSYRLLLRPLVERQAPHLEAPWGTGALACETLSEGTKNEIQNAEFRMRDVREPLALLPFFILNFEF